MNATHYHCRPCDRVFRQGECHFRVVNEPFEFWGQRGVQRERIDLCPFCGGEDIDDVVPCLSCESALPADGHDDCQRCIERAEAIDLVTETGKYQRIKALRSVLADIAMTQRGAA